MWIGGLPLYALAAGKYLSALLPAVDPIFWGVAILTLCLVINIVGIKPTAFSQFLLTFILISCILVFILAGVYKIDVKNLQLQSPMGVLGTVIASGLLFTLCAGGLWVIDLGSEIRAPGRAYRIGLPIAIGTVFLITLLVEIVALGTTPASMLVGKTLVEAASRFMSEQLLVIWVLAAILAIFTTINAVFTIISRNVIVLSQDGVFPKLLSVVNDRYRTPHNALILSYLIALIPVILNVSLLQLGAVLNLGMTLQFSIVLLGAYKLSKDGLLPGKVSPPSMFGFLGGILSAAVLFLVIDITYKIVLLASGVLIFAVLYKKVRIRNDLLEVAKEAKLDKS
jgi:APA family basic amino acid/polyamine antiporter